MAKMTEVGRLSTETVEQYLARAGVVTQLQPGESGQVWPVRRKRKKHIEFLKGLDRKRLAARGIGEPTPG